MPVVPRRWWPVVVPLLFTGCASSAAVTAADAGDVDRLRATLAERSDVDVGEARDIARKLMVRSIERAEGLSGAKGLEALGPTCAVRFDDALASRAAHDDELAARAQLLRMEAGLLGPLSHAGMVVHAEPHWRAVGVRSLSERYEPDARRGLVDLERASRWRRKLMEDPAAMVRLAAVRAAGDARDPSDVTALREAARVDPDRETRLAAVAALGAIANREAVMGLRDLWAQGDEETRLAIVAAWKNALGGKGECSAPPQSPRCIARHQLQRVAESDEGMVTLAAALAILDGHGPGEADTVVGNAAAVVERLVDGASTRVRRHAIEEAPLTWAHLVEAIVDASKSPDDAVAASALGRIAEIGGKEREPALVRLRELAKQRGLGGEAARKALAAAGDASAADLVASDAKASSVLVRREAATRLARMGSVGHAVPLLADVDPSVRSTAACAILEMAD
jgi:HEAT repeat protein